jgi:hypothetical protein
MPHPTQSDPHDLLRQAIAAYQLPGVALTPDQVSVGAHCLSEAIPGLLEVLRHGWGVVTITVNKGKLNKVEWLQSRFY